MSRFSDELTRLLSIHELSYAALGRRAFYTRQYVKELANGTKNPSREAARRIDDALHADGQLFATLDTGSLLVVPQLPLWTPAMTPEPGRPLDDTDAAAVRATVGSLVHLDTTLGSVGILDTAVRAFRTAADRLAIHGTRGPAADMQAAVADLGICASWIAADATDHNLARQLGMEALNLAEFSGETRLRRFLLSHLSMLGEHSGRGAEALAYADRALADNPRDVRVQAMFSVRRARALGLLGAGDRALAAWDEAESLLDVGPDGGDGLTYWLHESEMALHKAVILARNDRADEAIEWGQRAVQLLPEHQGRDQVLFRAMLLADAAQAKAWTEVESTASELMGIAAAAQSGRVPVALHAALRHLEAGGAPAQTRAAVRAVIDQL